MGRNIFIWQYDQKMDRTLVLSLWSLIVCNECCVIIWWSINSLSQMMVWCVWFPGQTQPGLSKFPSLPQSCTWGWFRGCSTESVVITVQASPLCSALLSVCVWWSGIVTNIFQWPAEHMILETLIWSGLMCECWYECEVGAVCRDHDRRSTLVTGAVLGPGHVTNIVSWIISCGELLHSDSCNIAQR